jgi:hypothetical protein
VTEKPLVTAIDYHQSKTICHTLRLFFLIYNYSIYINRHDFVFMGVSNIINHFKISSKVFMDGCECNIDKIIDLLLKLDSYLRLIASMKEYKRGAAL